MTLLTLYLPVGREFVADAFRLKNVNKQAYLKKLGEHISKLRKKMGYSQDRLYLEAGFSRGTISKIENGLVDPKITTLKRIADTIGVPLDQLVNVH